MAQKIISEKALLASVKLLSKMEQMQRTAQELARSVDARVSVLEEFIRANITGDDKAFGILKPVIIENRGNTRLYYTAPQYGGRDPDRIRTKRIVAEAQEWAQHKEKEDGKDPEVPGSPPDPASGEGSGPVEHSTRDEPQCNEAGSEGAEANPR